jgi:hypothetical protein
MKRQSIVTLAGPDGYRMRRFDISTAAASEMSRSGGHRRAAASKFAESPLNRRSPMQNQTLSDLPAGVKDELRRTAGATKSVGNLPAAPLYVFPSGSGDRPKPAYSLRGNGARNRRTKTGCARQRQLADAARAA